MNNILIFLIFLKIQISQIDGGQTLTLRPQLPADLRLNTKIPNLGSTSPRSVIANLASEGRPEARQMGRADWETELFRDIFSTRRYVKEARPSGGAGNDIVDVSVEMVVMKIDEISAEDQEIGIDGYFKITWVDDRLGWNPYQFGGIQWIVVPSRQIWLPDIGIINSPDQYALTRDQRFSAVLDYLGNVIWVPSGNMRSRCPVDITHMPFDNQTCFFRVESWSYPQNMLNLTGIAMKPSPVHYVTSSEWHLAGTETRNRVVNYDEPGSYNNFTRIEFVLFMNRKTNFYIMNAILPLFILSIIQCLTHLLAIEDCHSRLGFTCSNFLGYFLLTSTLKEIIPKGSPNVPAITIYSYLILLILIFQLIEIFFTSNRLIGSHLEPPSRVTWGVIVEVLGRFALFNIENYNKIYQEIVEKTIKPVKSSNDSKNRQSLMTHALILKPDEHDELYNYVISEDFKRNNQKRRKKTGLRPSISELPGQNCRNRNGIVSNYFYNDGYESPAYCCEQRCQQQLIINRRAKTPPPRSNKNQQIIYQNANFPPNELVSTSKHQLTKTLASIKSELAALKVVTDEINEKMKQKKCKDVWRGLFEIIDRYLFLISLIVCLTAPLFLFYIFPQQFPHRIHYIPHAAS